MRDTLWLFCERRSAIKFRSNAAVASASEEDSGDAGERDVTELPLTAGTAESAERPTVDDRNSGDR